LSSYLKQSNNPNDNTATSSLPTGTAELVHVPCSLLKQWFRDLTQPIIPSSLYQQAIQSATIGDVKTVCDIVNNRLASPYSCSVLRFTLEYLRKLAQPDIVSHTKMTLSNLSIVFAPNILRSAAVDPLHELANQKFQQAFFDILLKNY